MPATSASSLLSSSRASREWLRAFLRRDGGARPRTALRRPRTGRPRASDLDAVEQFGHAEGKPRLPGELVDADEAERRARRTTTVRPRMGESPNVADTVMAFGGPPRQSCSSGSCSSASTSSPGGRCRRARTARHPSTLAVSAVLRPWPRAAIGSARQGASWPAWHAARRSLARRKARRSCLRLSAASRSEEFARGAASRYRGRASSPARYPRRASRPPCCRLPAIRAQSRPAVVRRASGGADRGLFIASATAQPAARRLWARDHGHRRHSNAGTLRRSRLSRTFVLANSASPARGHDLAGRRGVPAGVTCAADLARRPDVLRKQSRRRGPHPARADSR